METSELKRIVEAVLFVSEKPLTVKDIWHQLFGASQELQEKEKEQKEKQEQEEQQEAQQEAESGAGVDKQAVAEVLALIQQDYSGRGIRLQQIASGYRFQVEPDLAPWVLKLKEEKPARYSRAVLETLSIIAYKQPITRAEIEDIRGVAVSTQIVKSLQERQWIRVVGYKDAPGKPALLATTHQFLDYFNLTSLNELPPLAEIKEMN